MLHHMNRAAAKTPSVSYRNSYNSTTNTSSYTFSASDIGTANTSRLVVVQVHGQASTGTRSVSFLNINSISAIGYQNTARLYHNSLWALAVPTGTTASITVIFSGTMLNCLIAVYALYDLNSSNPVDSQATTATNATTISLTTSARQKGIVIGGITGAANATTTWTGVTERYDTNVESTVRSGGESVIATTNASYSVQADTTVSGNLTLVAGSWR